MFGNVRCVRFQQQADQDVHHAILWQPVLWEANKSDLFRLFGTAEKNPELGYAPKLLGYTTRPRVADDASNDSRFTLHRDEHPLETVWEMLIEPPPESLRSMLDRRISDQLAFSEDELWTILESLTGTLVNGDHLGWADAKISLDRVATGLAVGRPLLYHPLLCGSPADTCSLILDCLHNQRGRNSSVPKAYCSPELVELALESRSAEELRDKSSRFLDRSQDWVFALGLLILELGSLVEEEIWYEPDGNMKWDIVEVKVSAIRSQYSEKLAQILEHMVRPANDRISLGQLATVLGIGMESTLPEKQQIVANNESSGKQKVFHQSKQRVPRESAPLQSRPVLPLVEKDTKPIDNFMSSDKKTNLNFGAQISFEPQVSVGGELSFGIGRCYMSSTSHSASMSREERPLIRNNLLQETRNTQIVPNHIVRTVPVENTLRYPVIPPSSPPTIQSTQVLRFPQAQIQPTVTRMIQGPPVSPVTDASRSPRVVSVTKYEIRDGQKVLISREEYPPEGGVRYTASQQPVPKQATLTTLGLSQNTVQHQQPQIPPSPTKVYSLSNLAKGIQPPTPQKEHYQSTSEEFSKKFQEVQSILDNLIATREAIPPKALYPVHQEAQKPHREHFPPDQQPYGQQRHEYLEDRREGDHVFGSGTGYRQPEQIGQQTQTDQESGIHDLLGDDFDQSDPEYEARLYPNFEDKLSPKPRLRSTLDFGASDGEKVVNLIPQNRTRDKLTPNYCCLDCRRLDQKLGNSRNYGMGGSCSHSKRHTPSTTVLPSDKSPLATSQGYSSRVGRQFSPRYQEVQTQRDPSDLSKSRSRSQKSKSSKSRSTSIGPLQRGAKKPNYTNKLRQPNLILGDFCPRYIRELTPPKKLLPLPQNELFIQTQLLRLLKQRDLKNLKSELLLSSRPPSREPVPNKKKSRTDGK